MLFNVLELDENTQGDSVHRKKREVQGLNPGIPILISRKDGRDQIGVAGKIRGN